MTRTRGRNTDTEPREVGAPGEWANRASCAGMSILLLDFFGKTRVDWGLSKKVCKACPVRRECLGYALDARLVHGVWGGLDPLELRFALGRDAQGETWTYVRQDVKCPFCRGDTKSVRTDGDDANASRQCVSCGFEWERAERLRKPRGRRPNLTVVIPDSEERAVGA